MTPLERAIQRARREILAGEAPVRRALARAWREAIDAFTGDLEAVTRMIADARAAGIDVNPDWLRRQDRYRELLTQAEYQFRRFATEGERILFDARVRAVSGGAQTAVEMAQAVNVPVTFGAAINIPAVERLVASLVPGSPVREVLDRYGPWASSVIERELTAGMIEGTGPREVVRTIRREIGGGASRARLDSLVRTEYMRSFRGSLGEQMQAMKRPGDKWRRVAAKDARTCLACIATDGELTDDIPIEFHIRCRCIFHLVPKGVVIPYESGPDWFARQSADVQRAMMPSQTAYDAFRENRLTLSSFVGRKRSPVWGPSIYERSGRAAMAVAGRRR